MSIYGTKEVFICTVARALELLFVEAHKRQPCNLFEDKRADRSKWKQTLSSPSPVSLPRDRRRDFDILTGLELLQSESSPSRLLRAPSRTLRVLLISTQTDTVLEWSFFHQDVVPFLKVTARRVGLDLVICDVRCGSREEEGLPVETLLAELDRCKAESAGLCCVALIGDKYGSRPSPSLIPKDEMEQLLNLMDPSETSVVNRCYVLDENYLDASYDPAAYYAMKPITDFGMMPFDEICDTMMENRKLSKELTTVALVLRQAAQKLWLRNDPNLL